MNLGGTKYTFPNVNRDRLRQLVSKDVQLTPDDSEMLLRAIDNDELMESQRCRSLMFGVFFRSGDDFAQQHAAELAKRSKFFGDSNHYLQNVGSAEGVYELLFSGQDGPEKILRAYSLRSGHIPDVFDSIQHVRRNACSMSAYCDYNNGYLITGRYPSIDHLGIYERLQMIFGDRMPHFFKVVLEDGYHEEKMRVTAFRFYLLNGSTDDAWPIPAMEIIGLFEPYVEYVERVDDESAVFLVGKRRRSSDEPLEFKSPEVRGLLDRPVQEVRESAVVKLAMNLHARPIVDLSHMVMSCGDGTRLFLKTDGKGPLEFAPPLFDLIELSLKAGSEVTLEGVGPRAKGIVEHARAYLENGEGPPSGSEGDGGGNGNGTDATSRGVKVDASSSLSSAALYFGGARRMGLHDRGSHVPKGEFGFAAPQGLDGELGFEVGTLTSSVQGISATVFALNMFSSCRI